MTNITPEQRLALARAVYPEQEWSLQKNRAVPLTESGMYFYPAHFPTQALDVLCWLLKNDNCNEIDCDVVRFYSDRYEYCLNEEHNCTPASLSDAIVRAAVRVMEGE